MKNKPRSTFLKVDPDNDEHKYVVENMAKLLELIINIDSSASDKFGENEAARLTTSILVNALTNYYKFTFEEKAKGAMEILIKCLSVAKNSYNKI